jgi:hypothetical protein
MGADEAHEIKGFSKKSAQRSYWVACRLASDEWLAPPSEPAKIVLMGKSMTACGLMNIGHFAVLSAIALTFSTATLAVRAENACSRVDRTLPKERAKGLGPVIAKQLDVKRAKISQSFRFGDWSVLYVSTDETDDAFVFYSGDPMRSRYVTLWGGVALESEETEIRAWTLKNAPGIPRILANCFAWHVTKER